MRLFFRRRKLWAVLCISITTISVLWTYRVRSWPKQDGRVRHESVHPVRTSLTRENINSVDYDSRTSVRGINGEFGLKKATQKGITRKPLYPVTRTTKVTRGSPIQRGLLQRLQEVETKMSKRKLHKESNVLHVSSLNVVQENALVYKQAFVALGYNVVFSNLDVAKLSMLKETDWQGVLCFTTGTSRNISLRCPMRYFSLLQEHTKVSPIPGLEKLLLRNDGFCYIMSASHHLAALENKPLSPLCFVLPAQLKLFSKERQEKRTQWTVKTHGSETTPMDTWGAIGISAWKIKDDSEDMVVQQLPDNVLLIGGEPVVVQVYVLVTSASPIRVYRHSEGHAVFPRKGEKSNWSLEMFIKHLESHYGEEKAGAAVQQMDDLIVTLFLVLEPSLITFFKGLEVEYPSFRTQNFFHLLQISFMFNSSLYPYILEVKDPKDTSIPQKIVQDTVNMVFNLSTKLNISHKIRKTLEVLLSGVKEPKCRKEVHQCITDDLLQYLLETRREADHLGNYNRLYPTHNGGKFNKLVTYLSQAGTGVEEHVGLIFGLGTPDLHNFLTAFERRFNLNMNVAMQDHKEGETTAAKTRDIRVLEGAVEVTGCDSDPEADPVLIKLDTYPTITLHPPFKSDVFIYQATVPFDTMVLQIWGRASTCKSGVRVNSRNEDSLSSNHSLGVGWNKFAIFVDDTSQSTPETVYTYSLYVFRQRRSEKESPFIKECNHQVCAQLQECDLKVFPNKSCGLNKLPAVSWNVFLFRQEQLPRCETGHESGRWVLPCASCDDPKSCYWKEAVWAPYSCQYRFLSRDETRTCLAKKKILFVGDSTNRGMMYYLMEKLNGSLSKWEKTHAMKIYSDELNGSRTSVSFAYYPQFWLSENMRPVFVKALYQLIARFLPLENSTNTILVVGGVQWIWPHHITETKKALTSLGLNGIKVIIKSLGAGFHLPVPGLLRQDLAGQRRTAERNQRVIKAAKQLGYDVVDTFGMTVSRYKDFLQGKCGCHFHKVVDMRSLMKEADEVPSPLLEDGGEKNSDFLPRYHVIGPINSVYSELVINRMCS